MIRISTNRPIYHTVTDHKGNVLENTRPKSAGQLAYEADVAARPIYHDGTSRKTWAQLSDIARWSWTRDEGDAL